MTQVEILQMIWKGMSQLLGPAFKMEIKTNNGWTIIPGINNDDTSPILSVITDNLGEICNIQINNSELILSAVGYMNRIDLHDPNQFDPIDIVIDIEKLVEEKRRLRNERDAKWKATPRKVELQLPKELKKPEAKVKKHLHQRRWHRRR